jgi:hypothetical protein
MTPHAFTSVRRTLASLRLKSVSISKVRPGRLTRKSRWSESLRGIRVCQSGLTLPDNGALAREIDIDRGLTSRDTHRDHQPVFLRDAAYETSLAVDTGLVQKTADSVHASPAEEIIQIRSKVKIVNCPGQETGAGRNTRNPRVDKKEDAGREYQHERADEESGIRMQVASDPVGAFSHQEMPPLSVPRTAPTEPPEPIAGRRESAYTV